MEKSDKSMFFPELMTPSTLTIVNYKIIFTFLFVHVYFLLRIIKKSLNITYQKFDCKIKKQLKVTINNLKYAHAHCADVSP